MLELKGHEVIGKAFNGNDCLNKLNNSGKAIKPDFILMDHRMPIKDGLNTTIELLAEKPNLKIIFVSADISIKDKAISVGAIDFLRKPFGLNSFYNIIDNLINHYKLKEPSNKNKHQKKLTEIDYQKET
jgi:DNA-binding NtrC family response regulator